MTIQEKAIEQLERISEHLSAIGEKEDYTDIAIKALETTCIEDYPTCTECEHYDSEKHYCPRFCQVIKDTLAEAQPCEDAVSREAVIDHICEDKECYKEECKGRTLKRCPDLQWVFDLPSVTPQRKRGKWIFREDMGHQYCCSECGCPKPSVNDYYYKKIIGCPYCLADMSGGGEGETDN